MPLVAFNFKTYTKISFFLFLEFTGEVLRKLFDDCFVDLSFPRVPVTPPIIMLCFESPATTFGLVKATRLTAYLCYDP